MFMLLHGVFSISSDYMTQTFVVLGLRVLLYNVMDDGWLNMGNFCVIQEQQRVAVGPGNAHFISVRQVSSDTPTLRRDRCEHWPAAAAAVAVTTALLLLLYTCGDDGAGVGIAEDGSAIVVYDVLLSGGCSQL